MHELEFLLQRSAERHRGRHCPRQVLGVRMGLHAAEILDLDLPRTDKRLFALVESDGCLTDGIAAATGCWWGSRTMYLMDYGKTAVTFVDTQEGRAVRVSPSRESRLRAQEYAPDAPDRWHAQLDAYQVMPAEELLIVESVSLRLSLNALISKYGMRVVCEVCGEDVMNEREVRQGGHLLCRACAGKAYYQRMPELAPLALQAEALGVRVCRR